MTDKAIVKRINKACNEFSNVLVEFNLKLFFKRVFTASKLYVIIKL